MTKTTRDPPFVRDENLTMTGFSDFEEARKAASSIKQDPNIRIRIRLRNRTDRWDVVVKRKRSSDA